MTRVKIIAALWGAALLNVPGCTGGSASTSGTDSPATGGPGVAIQEWHTEPLRLKNRHPFPVVVIIDNQRAGILNPYSSGSLSAMKGGHAVQFVAPDGSIVEDFDADTD